MKSLSKRMTGKPHPDSVVVDTSEEVSNRVTLGDTLILTGSLQRDISLVKDALDSWQRGRSDANKFIQGKINDDVARLHQVADLLETLERERLLAISNGTSPPRLQRNHITFQVGGVGFAVHLDHVRQVIGAQGLALGDHGARIRRAIVLDESIVPVFDLSTIFLERDSIQNGFAKVLLLTVSGQPAAFLIYSEVKVVDLKGGTICQKLTAKNNPFSRFSKGEVEIDSSVVTLLDLTAKDFFVSLQRQ